MKTGISPPVEQLPILPSPYGDGPIPAYRHLKFSSFWFATNFIWGALMTLMLPNELRHMMPHMRVFALTSLTAAAALVAVLVPLIAGALSDRCTHPLGRRRPFIIVGVGLNLIGLSAMWFSYHHAGVLQTNLGHEPNASEALRALLSDTGFLRFTGAYMVVQLGNNIATAAYSGLIPDLVPEGQRGAASGYMAVMSQAGTLLGIVGVGMVLRHMGESAKYLALMSVLGSVSLITIMGVQETRLTTKPKPIVWRNYLRSLWIDPREHPDFAWVWVTRFLVMLGFYAILPLLNYYLIDVIGIENPDQAAATLSGIILVFASISGYLGGVISDRIGRKKVVTAANLSMAVVGLGFIACRGFNAVLIVGILFGLGYGAYISVDWALGTDVLPSKADAAKEMGVWHIAMTLPQTLAAPIAGVLIESAGKKVLYQGDETIIHYATPGYTLVFIFASICFGISAFLLKNVRGVR